MKTLTPGDRVTAVSDDHFSGLTGTVKLTVRGPKGQVGYDVRLDGDSTNRFFARHELHYEAPTFVNVVTSRQIWVTLPGDNAGHKLSEADANALFRQLEEIL